jgi:hypothetical protein
VNGYEQQPFDPGDVIKSNEPETCASGRHLQAGNIVVEGHTTTKLIIEKLVRFCQFILLRRPTHPTSYDKLNYFKYIRERALLPSVSSGEMVTNNGQASLGPEQEREKRKGNEK